MFLAPFRGLLYSGFRTQARTVAQTRARTVTELRTGSGR
jgi:hypothetical protein